jgi:hypothetical protein
MKIVELKKKTKNGLLRAVYAPEDGMNLISLSLNGCEVIDQSTKPLFDERKSGLGPLIGPHFYHRKEGQIPPLEDKSIFKHTANKEVTEPLSHGIGRYVPWNYEASDMSLRAHLSGLDSYKDHSLASLEGFDFKLDYEAHLTEKGLIIHYKGQSPSNPNVIGLHYYYSCDSSGHVQIQSDANYADMGEIKGLKTSWVNPEFNGVDFPLTESSDYTFRRENSKNEGNATLFNQEYKLHIHYHSKNDEHSFQLYHPQNESFCCIEPISAKNPRGAVALKNDLKVQIRIELN